MAPLLPTGIRPPLAPEQFPSIVYKDKAISILRHFGFTQPSRGPKPEPRMLYGAKDGNGERHWRGSLDEIKALIDRNFETAPLASEQ